MKKVFIPFLSLLIFILSSCNKDGDDIRNYSDVPAIVAFSSETFQPTIITSLGTFLAPELQKFLYTAVVEGDAIWTYFTVNYDKPDDSGANIAYDLTFAKIETAGARATWGGESVDGSYNIPIEKMWIADVFNNRMFLVFEITVPNDQKMMYEMTYDLNEKDNPEVYIRAKKNNPEGSGITTTVYYPFAFNMSHFFSTYKSADNLVKFKIKYKIGINVEGNDQFEYFDLGKHVEVKVE